MKTLLITGPSAVGKTYLASELIRLFPDAFTQAKLYTTRSARQGEAPTDRIFINEIEFSKRTAAGEYLITGEFAGNAYGYTHDSLYPGSAHLLVNTWPDLLPQFFKHEHIVTVALQVPPQALPMLEIRIKDRADPISVLQRRKKQVRLDTAAIERYKEAIEVAGKVFYVIDDDTIPLEVIPWIARKFELES